MAAVTKQMDALRDAVAHFSRQPTRQKLLISGLIATFVGTLTWSIRDYNDFISLGKGGLPANVFGWLIVTLVIRPFTLSKNQSTSTSDYPNEGAHSEIEKLPQRRGERAVAKGIIPHRQITQKAPEDMKKRIQALYSQAVNKYPELLHIKKSLYEKHNDALFITDSVLNDKDSKIALTAKVARGEISHMHMDLSVHAYMSPADAKLVIEKNWAERHRLARPKPLFGMYLFRLAPTYLLFYGPRDDEELDAFRIILQSSIRFMTGSDDITLTME